MVGTEKTESPLEEVTDVTGENVAGAFELLSSETRLAILLALWDAQDPGPPASELGDSALSFSELRERVGIRDSGQFNYHLDKLTERFVTEQADGYVLNDPAEQILHAVFAGTVTEHESFEAEPVDGDCNRCGEAMVIDYRDGMLVERCTACEGFFQPPERDSGILAQGYRPPAGLLNRTPQEFHRDTNLYSRHQIHTAMEGVCPDCTGSISASIFVCSEHDADEPVCPECGSFWHVQAFFVCDVCKYTLGTPGFAPMSTDMRVKAFFYERGLDIDECFDASRMKPVFDAIQKIDVTGEDPLEVTVQVALEGDRLEVVLDEDAQVAQVRAPVS